MGIIYTQHYFSLLNTAPRLKTNMSSQSHILVISETNMRTDSNVCINLTKCSRPYSKTTSPVVWTINCWAIPFKIFSSRKKLEMYVHNWLTSMLRTQLASVSNFFRTKETCRWSFFLCEKPQKGSGCGSLSNVSATESYCSVLVKCINCALLMFLSVCRGRLKTTLLWTNTKH